MRIKSGKSRHRGATAGWPILSRKLALVFQLLQKGGIRFTIPHALRSTTQVSGPDFSRAKKALQSEPFLGPQARAQLLPASGLSCWDAMQRSAQKKISKTSAFIHLPLRRKAT